MRYQSLDVLRGITVAFMIVVNTPGDWNAVYPPLRHAEWHGFTPTDWVFPAFLFAVGNALSFSKKQLVDLSTSEFLRKVLKRTVIIFIIGFLLNAFPFVQYEDGTVAMKKWYEFRLWGVLQRIALCYGIGSLMVHFLPKKMLIPISAAILLLYWWILVYFGPEQDPFSLAGNVVGKVDRLYLPVANMYPHFNFPFDPLGLLSTLPAVVHVIFGYVTGLAIQQQASMWTKIGGMALVGLLFVVIAEYWNVVLPINKPLWTSSYVLCSTGYTLILLAILILVIEVFSFKRWAYFFEVFGKNPLFIYMLSLMLISLMNVFRFDGASLKSISYQAAFKSWLSDLNASLLFAITYMLLLWLIGYVLDRKKIYVKV